jgi:KUP system potassium uptake protein
VGLEVATSAARPLVVPLTIVILFVLFSLQHRGTGHLGRAMGPVMGLWFLALAALGVRGIAHNPGVLAAVNPIYAVRFFAQNGLHGTVVLGSVVLAITGTEALYADLGHFGRRPIRLSWFSLVFPALVLNYLGQGAMLLAHPERASNPFYELVPEPLLYPMVGLATAATVIASQALISGVFSLTRQAVQLGFLPRTRVVHTSGETAGQIFVPTANRLLMFACIALVLAFRRSSSLAAAYGIAVTLDMVITSLIFFAVARQTWGWKLSRALPLLGLFLFFDLAFFSSSLLKVADGGWVPLVIALGLMSVMLTWRDGRVLLAAQMSARTIPLKMFIDDLAHRKPHRVPGTAVFMSSSPQGTPVALLHHFKHTPVVHQQVVVLAVLGVDRPTLPDEERVQIEPLGEGFFRVRAEFGFMESPNVPEVLRLAKAKGLETLPGTTSYFLGRETMLTTGREKMMRWRKTLFAFLSRNAEPANAWFALPPGRVIELGMQIEL